MAKTLKELTSRGKESSFYNNYTIPNDVEEVTATVDLTYHVGMEVGKDMKSSTGTYRKEPALARHYYIFTSEAACKKAFELMTASSVTGAISNVFGGDKKPNAKSCVGRRRLRRVPDVWQRRRQQRERRR